MRRQARATGGGARLWRSASALQVWLWLLIFVFQNECSASKSIQPGYLDFDNLPETNFTCEGKVIGGYYADLETSCQMFHVCTVGQQDEPMDIKFLCLNGTVFDQETRVCERVDEVDCTKSEKFYSLNLELYGSTIAPPTIKADQTKPQTTDRPHESTKQSEDEESDSDSDDASKTNHKVEIHPEYQDSTEDPIQEISKTEPSHKTQDYTSVQPTHQTHPGQSQHVEPIEENQEEEEIDSEIPDYEDDYTQPPPTTTQRPLTTTPVPTTTPPPQPSPRPHQTASPQPSHSSISVPIKTQTAPQPTLDPALLSPQDFIFHHRGPGSEAISFQRQGLRPADGVYITHAPPQQFDHFEYESSRTAPRPNAPHPVPFVKRPPPAPFRATTLDPRDQILRPGPSSQPSERHETSINHRPYPAPLPAQRPLPFEPYYYERKRSDEFAKENESTLSARSVGPPVTAERPLPKPKSPPRVIVTASASVSDSNGKRLNYTVGNVVSAVKPIVNINYDDYKESDLIFDPFFLDVPKLQKRRKSRGSRQQIHQNVFRVPATAAAIFDEVKTTTSRVTSQATTTEKGNFTTSSTTSTTTAAWNPNDYVDDNYEPHAYIPPMHPLAVLMPFDRSKMKEDKFHDLIHKKPYHSKKPLIIRIEESTPSPTQSTSSQRAPAPPPPAPAAAPCLPAASPHCPIRA